MQENLRYYPWMQEFGLEGRSWVDVPIRANNQTLGLWTLDTRDLTPLSEAKSHELRRIALIAALKMYETRQQRIEKSADVFNHIDYDEPFVYCMKKICRAMKTSFAAFFFIDSIKCRVQKVVEVAYNGTDYSIVPDIKDDMDYPTGKFLTGGAAIGTCPDNIPDYETYIACHRLGTA